MYADSLPRKSNPIYEKHKFDTDPTYMQRLCVGCLHDAERRDAKQIVRDIVKRTPAHIGSRPAVLRRYSVR